MKIPLVIAILISVSSTILGAAVALLGLLHVAAYGLLPLVVAIPVAFILILVSEIGGVVLLEHLLSSDYHD